MNLTVNLVFSVLSVIVATIIGFAKTSLFTKNLTLNDYGLWILIFTISNYVLFLDGGIEVAITKLFSEKKGDSDRKGMQAILDSSLALYIAASFLAVSALFLLSEPIIGSAKISSSQQPVARYLLLIMGANFCLSLPFLTVKAAIRGFQRTYIVTVFETIRIVTELSVFLLVFIFNKSLFVLAWVYLINTQVYNLCYILYCKKAIGFFPNPIRFSKAASKDIFRFSLSVLVVRASDFLFYHSDKLIIGYFVSAQAVAIYSVGMTLSQLCRRLSSSFASVFLPVASELSTSQDAPEKLRKLFLQTSRISLFSSVPMIVVFLVAGKAFIALWAGKAYESSHLIFVILIVPQIFAISQQGGMQILMGTNDMAPVRTLSITVSLAAIFSGFLLVFPLKETGVAIGSSAACIVGRLFWTRIYLSRFNFSGFQYFRKVDWPFLFSGVITGGLLFICTIYFPVSNYLRLVAYILVSYLLSLAVFWILFIEADEISLIRNIPARLRSKLKLA